VGDGTETTAAGDVLPLRHADLEVAGFDDEFVVFDPRCSEVHVVSNVTAVVFDACDGKSSRADLIRDLVDVAGLGRSDATRAVDESLAALARRGLLVGTTPEGRPP